MIVRRSPDAISPTAHYTAEVWTRHGLSHPALTTPAGRALHGTSRVPMALSGAVGGPTLESFLLARHRLIDYLLEREIAAGRVSQVLEVACGLSPRGWRFARRHGEAIDYVEADLPAMAGRKREALAAAGTLGERHRVVEIDALRDDGPLSLASVTGALDPDRGVAVITEGLLNYLDRAAVEGLWARFATALGRFPHGIYLSDLHLARENTGPLAAGFARALSVFVRGRVHFHFGDAAEARLALERAGFADAQLHRPPDFADEIEVEGRGAELVRVIEATVGRRT